MQNWPISTFYKKNQPFSPYIILIVAGFSLQTSVFSNIFVHRSTYVSIDMQAELLTIANAYDAVVFSKVMRDTSAKILTYSLA